MRKKLDDTTNILAKYIFLQLRLWAKHRFSPDLLYYPIREYELEDLTEKIVDKITSVYVLKRK